MGYYMSQTDQAFEIKKENFAACTRAIKDLGVNHSWVMDIDIDKDDIKECFEAWRWDIEDGDGDGNIDTINFEGEKAGDDELFMNAIAPYVESGSYIEMVGEEGETWQWRFENGKFKEVYAALNYDNSKEILGKILETKELLPMLMGLHPDLDKRIEAELKKK